MPEVSSETLLLLRSFQYLWWCVGKYNRNHMFLPSYIIIWYRGKKLADFPSSFWDSSLLLLACLYPSTTRVILHYYWPDWSPHHVGSRINTYGAPKIIELTTLTQPFLDSPWLTPWCPAPGSILITPRDPHHCTDKLCFSANIINQSVFSWKGLLLNEFMKKWIWNDYEMNMKWHEAHYRPDETPRKSAWSSHRSCHFLLCSWISRSFSIRSSICVMFSSSSLVLHVAKCVNHSVSASEKCGGMWWLQVVVRVLLEPAM